MNTYSSYYLYRIFDIKIKAYEKTRPPPKHKKCFKTNSRRKGYFKILDIYIFINHIFVTFQKYPHTCKNDAYKISPIYICMF